MFGHYLSAAALVRLHSGVEEETCLSGELKTQREMTVVEDILALEKRLNDAIWKSVNIL